MTNPRTRGPIEGVEETTSAPSPATTIITAAKAAMAKPKTPRAAKAGNDGGLSGLARFQAAMASAPAKDTPEYDQYVLGLPLDPADLLYQRMVIAEQDAVRKRRKAAGVIEPGVLTQIKQPPKKYVPQRRGAARLPNDAPYIKGLPTNIAEILSNAEGGGQSPWLQNYLKDEGIEFDPNTERVLAKSGYYVWMGEQGFDMTVSQAGPQATSEGGHTPYMRDVYLYVEDAQALPATWGVDRVKEIQAKLGLPETGIADAEIFDLWDDAVKDAARRAKAGVKVDLMLMFNMKVDEIAANGGLGGHGGGGGAKPRTEDDYYFDMMQVLGDISGVKG